MRGERNEPPPTCETTAAGVTPYEWGASAPRLVCPPSFPSPLSRAGSQPFSWFSCLPIFSISRLHEQVRLGNRPCCSELCRLPPFLFLWLGNRRSEWLQVKKVCCAGPTRSPPVRLKLHSAQSSPPGGGSRPSLGAAQPGPLPVGSSACSDTGFYFPDLLLQSLIQDMSHSSRVMGCASQPDAGISDQDLHPEPWC